MRNLSSAPGHCRAAYISSFEPGQSAPLRPRCTREDVNYWERVETALSRNRAGITQAVSAASPAPQGRREIGGACSRRDGKLLIGSPLQEQEKSNELEPL